MQRIATVPQLPVLVSNDKPDYLRKYAPVTRLDGPGSNTASRIPVLNKGISCVFLLLIGSNSAFLTSFQYITRI